MKQLLSIVFLCFIALPGKSQDMKVEDKIFNFGVKAGLNSAMPVINSITIDDKQAENITHKYKVGTLAAAFCRINIDRFFLQPSLAVSRTSGSIYYQIETGNGEAASENFSDRELAYKLNNLEIPVLVGYKIVKEDVYGLTLMAGPNFKYGYKKRYWDYSGGTTQTYENDKTPWGVGIVCGVGVSIWRLFFDVTYEFGINKVDSDFKDTSLSQTGENGLSVDKRTNLLSFSLGLLF